MLGFWEYAWHVEFLGILKHIIQPLFYVSGLKLLAGEQWYFLFAFSLGLALDSLVSLNDLSATLKPIALYFLFIHKEFSDFLLLFDVC